MTNVFAGGLAYEYSQEENDYGLVQIKKNGAVETLEDFTKLAKAYAKTPSAAVPKDAKTPSRPTVCPKDDDKIFDNITANNTLPHSLGTKFITSGVSDKSTRGKFVSLKTKATNFNIVVEGKNVSDKSVKQVFGTDNSPLKSGGHGQNTGGTDAAASKSDSDNKDTSGAASIAIGRGAVFAGSLGAVALTFGLFL